MLPAPVRRRYPAPPSAGSPAYQTTQPAPRPTVAAVLLPQERSRVEAAGSGCFALIHRDSIADAVRTVRERPVDAVLVSVHRCEPEQIGPLVHLVRGLAAEGYLAVPADGIADHTGARGRADSEIEQRCP